MATPAAPVRPAAISIKPTLMSASPPPTNASSPSTLMSKEWVVPPRPRPGRKPATDTPPTKRKAQNRAAQRAFRERRAARVGELEEQIKEIEDEHDQETDALRANIEQLEKQVEQYQEEIATLIERCRKAEKQWEDATSAVPLPRRDTAVRVQDDHEDTETSIGCGKCTPDTNCQCLDDALHAIGASSVHKDPSPIDKRPHSPAVPQPAKRVKLEPSDTLEIDFTQIYASKTFQETSRPEVVSPTSAAADPCGFCSDGTPCICAEMAAEAEQRQVAGAGVTGNRRRQISQYTPPPSEGDVTSTQQLASASCAGGPGTCSQCLADPNSTLFCKSLAASRPQAQAQPGCCGSKGADGGCCQSQPNTRSTRSNPTPAQPLPGITLTCADAYTTLSRHPGYERASEEIASWMPKLHAGDNGSRVVEGRQLGAMEIDAANVMSVLRDFDRRFGSSK